MLKAVIRKTINKMGYTIQKKAYDAENTHDLIPEASDFESHLMDTALRYSMCSRARMWSLIQSIYHIHNNNIPGDIVECGVWRGGNIILAANLCDHLKDTRNLWAYDTYEGMSEPSNHDVDIKTQQPANDRWRHHANEDGVNEWCMASYEDVKQNFETEIKGSQSIHMIKGKVEDTLLDPKNLPEKISILRLDTDFYESTKAELEILYPRLQPGGVLLIDDYGHWQGARKAVDEYFKGEHIWLHRIDYTARLMIKE